MRSGWVGGGVTDEKGGSRKRGGQDTPMGREMSTQTKKMFTFDRRKLTIDPVLLSIITKTLILMMLLLH